MKCAEEFCHIRQLWTTACIYNLCFFLIFQPVPQKGSSTAGEEQKQKPGRTSSMKLATKTGCKNARAALKPQQLLKHHQLPGWLASSEWKDSFLFLCYFSNTYKMKMLCTQHKAGYSRRDSRWVKEKIMAYSSWAVCLGSCVWCLG